MIMDPFHGMGGGGLALWIHMCVWGDAAVCVWGSMFFYSQWSEGVGAYHLLSLNSDLLSYV